jgi:tetratricopeptide (TPR) repeat protein
VEELYLAGLRLDQFYNAVIDSAPYYSEALRRDPGDYRVNTQLGLTALKGFRWVEAEQYLRTAVDRITSHYTMPRDGEAFYYLGLALLAQGKLQDAYDYFYKASWSVAWHSPAYYSLALIDCRRHEFAKALAHLDRSIITNSENLKARTLKAVVLRRLNETAAAQHQLEMLVEKNPLHLWSRNELASLLAEEGEEPRSLEELASLKGIMRGNPEAYLELAIDYGNYGFWDEAIEILSRVDIGQVEDGTRYPMVYYYLGHYWAQKGEKAKALQNYRRASEMPVDYCFPYRAESFEVLEGARRASASDARARYYLGNLLYDHQPSQALRAWEESRQLDGTFSIVHRNLAHAYARVDKDLGKAVISMERAVEAGADDPRLYYELDVLYESAGVSLDRRIDVLERNKAAVDGRVDAITRQVLVYVQSGAWNKAIEVLQSHHFNRWEGGGMVRMLFVDAHLLRGSKRLHDGDSSAALSDFQAADSYPPNLEQGRPVSSPRFAQVFYYKGVGYEATGDLAKAKELWRSAAETEAVGVGLYYQGLALSKLNEERLAAAKFNQFWDYANRRSQSDFFAKFSEIGSVEIQLAEDLYLRGLAFRGKGNEARARELLALALEKNPNHYWAEHHLQNP